MPLFGKKNTEQSAAASRLQAVLNASFLGDAFQVALDKGHPLEPFFWVNRAADKLPWDEGPEVFEAVRNFPHPLDEEHEVHSVVNALKDPLGAAERGELSRHDLIELHGKVTLIIWATMLSAARRLARAHPRVFEDKSPEEAERTGFSVFSNEMHQFAQAVNWRKMTGRDDPLIAVIGGMCLEVLKVRREWHDKFLQAEAEESQ